MRFRNFLKLWESATDEANKLQADIDQIDAQINQRVQPLQTKKQQLVKLLAQKQKQVEQERTTQANKQSNQQSNQSNSIAPSDKAAGIL